MPASNPTTISITAAEIALSAIDAAYLKSKYLVGLNMCGDDGQPLPDSFYTGYINSAISKIETFTGVDIFERTIVAEIHDYRVQDYAHYAFLLLYRVPIISVQEVRASYPTGQTIQIFPAEWVRMMIERSQINLVPTSGTLSQVLIGQGADYLPLIYSGLGYLPNLWEVDYHSGLKQDAIPLIVADAIGKMATVDILSVMSDLVHPLGVSSASVSVDGLSQSRSLQIPAFKARIDLYNQSLFGEPPNHPGLVKQIRDSYYGIPMASL